MKTFSSVLVFLTATFLTASCAQSVDVFQGRTRLKLRINLPTITEGTFENDGATVEPRYAMIVTSDPMPEFNPPPWAERPRSYQFSRDDGTFMIPLTDNEANPQEIVLTSKRETDLDRWVLVRLCRDSGDCSGASPTGPVRDYLWHLERAFYAGEETNTTLPVTVSTDPLVPAPYGCIADEWAAGRTDDVRTDLGKCFVFGCAQSPADVIWGCPGFNYDTACRLVNSDNAPSAGTHHCEYPPSEEE